MTESPFPMSGSLTQLKSGGPQTLAESASAATDVFLNQHSGSPQVLNGQQVREFLFLC